MSIQLPEQSRADLAKALNTRLNRALYQAAAWQLAVAGAQLKIREFRDTLYECTDDVASLRERMLTIAEQKTTSDVQQECYATLQGAMQEYSDITALSDECLLLLEEYSVKFQEKLKAHSERLDRVAKMERARLVRARPSIALGSVTETRRK